MFASLKNIQFKKLFVQLFGSPIHHWQQYLIFVFITAAFMFMPVQQSLNDWELNTIQFGIDSIIHLYDNPNWVYPPWAIILLIPLHYTGLAGVRLISLLVIFWLVKRKEWQFSNIFVILLSPYFIYTMYLANMDIIVFLLPIILWDFANEREKKTMLRVVAFLLLLVKPQGTIGVLLYLAYQHRREWKTFLLPVGIVSAWVIGTSLIGSPPLIVQWLENIRNPSPQNIFCWKINNISLSNHISYLPAIALVVLVIVGFVLYSIKRSSKPPKELICSALLMISLMISPYASHQSVSASLALVPTWIGFLVQWLVTILSGYTLIGIENKPVGAFLVFTISIYLYWRKTERIVSSGNKLE